MVTSGTVLRDGGCSETSPGVVPFVRTSYKWEFNIKSAGVARSDLNAAPIYHAIILALTWGERDHVPVV